MALPKSKYSNMANFESIEEKSSNVSNRFHTQILSSDRHVYTLAPRVPRLNVSYKLVADESRGALLGLYYDDSSGIFQMTSFGVFCSPTAVRGPSSEPASLSVPPSIFVPASLSVPNYRPILPRLGGSEWNHFSSQAALKDVSYLETCSIDGRCTGMILTYLDGHQSVLGQWHEDAPSKHRVIRSLELVDRQGLRFVLSKKDGYSYLERVELRPRGCGGHSMHPSVHEVVDVYYAVRLSQMFPELIYLPS